MPYCRDCGNEVQPNDKFCQECGGELNTAQTSPAEEPHSRQVTGQGRDRSNPPQTTPTDNSPHTQRNQTNNQHLSHPGEDGFAVKHAAIVGGLSLIPALISGIIIPGDFAAIGFIISIPLFTYLGYQKPTIKSAFSRQAFWSAILLLISPLMMIVYTVLFIGSETEGGAEQAGAAIGGTLLVILAFVVGLPLAGAFYIAHKKTKLPD